MIEKRTVFDKYTSQSLKGIAIIMMMFHHADYYKESDAVYFWPLAKYQMGNIAICFKICVAIYAFISGYGLFLNYKKRGSAQSASKWCLQRYTKALSGYWFVWVLALPLCQLVDGRTAMVYMKDGVYKSVAYLIIDFLGLANLFETPKLNGVWWYMSAALVFILLLPLIYRLRDELILVLLFQMAFIRVIFAGKGVGAYTGENSIYPFLTPFVIGCFFARYNLFDHWNSKCKSRFKRTFRFVAETCIVGAGSIFYHKIPKELVWEYHYGLYATLFILMCVDFIKLAPFFSKLLNYIGRHSANIFLTHTILLLYFRDLLMIPKYFALILLIWLLVSIALSILIETLKKATRYDKLIDWLGLKVGK